MADPVRGQAFAVVDGAALLRAADGAGSSAWPTRDGIIRVIWCPSALVASLRRWLKARPKAADAVVFVTEHVARRLAEQTADDARGAQLAKVFGSEAWRLKCAFGAGYFHSVVRPALGMCLLLAYKGTWLAHPYTPETARKLIERADGVGRAALFAPARRRNDPLELLLLDARAGDAAIHALAERFAAECIAQASTHLGVHANAAPRVALGAAAHEVLATNGCASELVSHFPAKELRPQSVGPAFAVLSYNTTDVYGNEALQEFANIGDDVQSLAAIQALLPSVHMFVDRNAMFAHSFFGTRPVLFYRLRFVLFVVISRALVFCLSICSDFALALGNALLLRNPRKLVPVRSMVYSRRIVNLLLRLTRLKPVPNTRPASGDADSAAPVWLFTPGRWDNLNHCGELASGVVPGVGAGGVAATHPIKPIFVGYRMDEKVWTSDAFQDDKKWLAMLNSQTTPIATRDKTCAVALSALGVRAVFAGCASLSLTNFWSSPLATSDGPAASSLGLVDAMMQSGASGKAATADATIKRSLMGAFQKAANVNEGVRRAEIYAVDADDSLLERAGVPLWVRKAATHMSSEVNSITVNGRNEHQHVFGPGVSPWEHFAVMFDQPRRFEFTMQRLATLAQAKVVMTTRVHVALPCVGMGVPVILLHRELGKDKLDADADSRITGLMRGGNVDNFVPFMGPVGGRFDGMLDLVHCGTAHSLADLRARLQHFPWHRPPPNPNVEKLKALRALSVAAAAAQVDALSKSVPEAPQTPPVVRALNRYIKSKS